MRIPFSVMARTPRRWLARLAALAVGISLVAGLEGLCRLCGWGRPALHDDPFVEFRSIRPLFVLNTDGSRYATSRARRVFFRPQSFATHKPKDEFRIFCLGASTVQGRPYAVETAFSTWLQLSLQAADDRHRWNVVNCGGVSYASYRLTPILEEVLHYEPDLIVIYTGQNEFLESRTFDHIQDRGEWLNMSLAAVSRLHTFTLVRDGYLRCRGTAPSDLDAGRPILPSEVQALLDYRGGLEEYHRDEAWRRNVIRQFGFNLRRMAKLAHDAGVEVILMNPVANIDMPPFKAEHRSDLSADGLARWESLIEEARGHFRRERYNMHAAVPRLEQACKIDPLHAGGWYLLAECYRRVGRVAEAHDAFVQAKELDICPLRILEPMNRAILDEARETGAPLVDVKKLFEQRSPNGIVGGKLLVDHVHPSIEGHQQIADALTDKLVELGRVSPAPGWRMNKRRSFQKHLDGLDDGYYVRAEQRLENLRLWTQGRMKDIRPPATASGH